MRPSLRELALNVVTVALTVTALGVAAQRLYAHMHPPAAGGVQTRSVSNWKSYALAGNRIGRAGAPVTVVIFSDFQCPYCKEAMHNLEIIQSKRPSDLAIVYRHFPLGFHRYANVAARASECAKEVGLFESMQDTLFAHQDSLGTIPWTQLAQRVGIRDTSVFRECLKKTSIAALVSRDSADGRRLGVSGTPVILVGELEFTGSPSHEVLSKAIDDAARHAERR